VTRCKTDGRPIIRQSSRGLIDWVKSTETMLSEQLGSVIGHYTVSMTDVSGAR